MAGSARSTSELEKKADSVALQKQRLEAVTALTILAVGARIADQESLVDQQTAGAGAVQKPPIRQVMALLGSPRKLLFRAILAPRGRFWPRVRVSAQSRLLRMVPERVLRYVGGKLFEGWSYRKAQFMLALWASLLPLSVYVGVTTVHTVWPAPRKLSRNEVESVA